MQPNLSISDLKLLPIPMESLEKQKLIIDNLNTANNLTLKVKKNLIKKKSNFLQLKYSLLKTHIKNKVA